ncbi:MAG: amino acid permease [Spirochaetia bacterium]
MALKKTLGFYSIYSIASGAMISSGIFILPALAFSLAGPGVVFSYFLAGAAAILGMMNVIELVTAMPKAGGDYYYITRSLGPLAGSISGLLSWAALSLKSAFAVYGLAQAGYILFGLPPIWVAVGMTLLFTLLNVVGVELAARAEGAMVGLLLVLLILFVVTGFPSIDISRFRPMLPNGTMSMLTTAGLVFVSFGGLINVVTVSEEVRKPKRNIPLGMFLSIISIVILYLLVLIVMVGNMDPSALSDSSTPVADTARKTFGMPGFIAVTSAAVLAFLTTANAGILSASRYPLAMARDRLVPKAIGVIQKKKGTPLVSVLVTGIVIGASQLLPLEQLVKAASSVILTTNILAAVAVIIIRQSKIPSYRPSFKVPLFPILQIITILLFIFLLVDIGLEAVEISAGLIGAGILLFLIYGRRTWKQDYALLHLVLRAANKKISSDHLENELIALLHEREETAPDDVDRVFSEGEYVSLDSGMTSEELFKYMSDHLKDRYPGSDLLELFLERESVGTTALTTFLAIPHIIIDDKEGSSSFQLAGVRCKEGIYFSDDRPAVKAVFFLIGSKSQRTLHLKVLASLAQIVETPAFEKKWLEVSGPKYLKSLLLSEKRGRFD